MNDVRRLSDEGDGFERQLLASARSDRMSERGRRALLAAVGAGAAGTAVSTATGAAGATTATADVPGDAVVRVLHSGVPKWIAWGLMGTTLTLAAAYGVTRRDGSSPSPPSAASPVAASAPPLPAIESAPPAAAPAPPAQSSSARGRPARTSPGAAATHAASADVDPGDTPSLSAELTLIERARAAVREGRARDAVAALDEHRTRFQRGAFEEEAAVLRIEALTLAGETATASRLAHSFLDTHPRSPYTSRVQRTLASLEAREPR